MDIYCKLLGINIVDVLNADPPMLKELSNGSVIEIFNYCQGLNVDVIAITNCIGKLANNYNVANRACLSKIYKVIKNDKAKRRKAKDEYRRGIFSIPSQSVQVCTIDCKVVEKQTEETEVEKLKNKLKDRRMKTEQFRAKNKQLKRKLERRKNAALKQEGKIIKCYKMENQKTINKLEKRLTLTLKNTNTVVQRHLVRVRMGKQLLATKQSELNKVRKDMKAMEAKYVKEIKQLKEEIHRHETCNKELKEKNERLLNFIIKR